RNEAPSEIRSEGTVMQCSRVRTCASLTSLSWRLFEPVVRGWLMVERRHFAEAVPPVKRLRLGQGLVGFQPHQRKPSLRRELREAVLETVLCGRTVGRIQAEVNGLVAPYP